MLANGHTGAINYIIALVWTKPALTPEALLWSPQGPHQKGLSDRWLMCVDTATNRLRKGPKPLKQNNNEDDVQGSLHPNMDLSVSRSYLELPVITWYDGWSNFAVDCIQVAKFSH